MTGLDLSALPAPFCDEEFRLLRRGKVETTGGVCLDDGKIGRMGFRPQPKYQNLDSDDCVGGTI